MSPAFLRRWHGYVGAFIAPSILFFTLTGALQLFNLHEAHGAYHPAPVIEKLSRVHMDQVFAPGEHHAPPPHTMVPGVAGDPANAAAPHDDDDQPAMATLLLKWFFLVTALGLALSTILGLWIALTRPQGRGVAIGLMVAGAAVPLMLLAL